MRSPVLIFTTLMVLGTAVHAGPFAPAAGTVGSTAVPKTSTAFTGWATGYTAYVPGTNVDASFRTPDKALGPAVGDSFDTVSLGVGGKITMTFTGSLYNGPGWDFAVFENSFSDTFLELAFVDVSTDGTAFFRFPAFSLTPSPVGAFGSVDPTNVDGLAGKYRQGYGTPFDLDIFRNVPLIDVNDINFIRITDVVGNGSTFDNWPASLGGPHPIYAPYPTTGSAGFDLDAIGARYLNPPPPPDPGPAIPRRVPLPLSAMLLLAAGLITITTQRNRFA